MQKGVGYSVTLNIVITFIIIVFAFIAAALIYFKSNKVGNIITEAIENHSGWSETCKNDISTKLASIGYNRRRLDCDSSIGSCSIVENVEDGYCVYLCFEDTEEYYYYKVKTNMFANIPIINDIVEMPIYSETNRMYNFDGTGSGPTVTYHATFSGSSFSPECMAVSYGTCTVSTPSMVEEDIPSGYTFDGWTLADSNIVVAPGGSATLKKTETEFQPVYSKTYVATFDKNNANSVSKSSQKCSVYYDSGETKCKIQLPSINPAARAIGWSTNKNSKTAEYKVGDIIEIDSSKTYYAITSEGTGIIDFAYFITLIGTGPEDRNEIEKSCEEGADGKCTLSVPNAPALSALSGWTFVGWNDDFNEVSGMSPGTTITLTDPINEYYAIYKKTFKATFDKNNASGISKNSQSCTIFYARRAFETKCSITFPEITPAAGTTVVGWSTNKNSKTAEYKAGDTLEIDSSKTYYAITDGKASNVYFAYFYPTGGVAIPQFCLADASGKCKIQIPSSKPTLSGWTFVGWNTDKTKTTGIESGEIELTSDGLKYYPIYKKTFKATFNKNTASSVGKENQNCSIYYNTGKTKCKVEMPTITAKSGAKVLGWADNSSATEAKYQVGNQVEISNSKTFYAITKNEVTYTVNFYTAAGVPIPKTCIANSGKCKVTVPDGPALSGWTFVGWNTDKTKTTGVASGEIELTSDGLKYYPIYKKTLTATFAKNKASSVCGGKESCTQKCSIFRDSGKTSCSVTLPAITAPSGISVLGWATDKNASGSIHKVGDSVNLTASTTYYAIVQDKSGIVYFANFISESGEYTKQCTTDASGKCKINIDDISKPKIEDWTFQGWNASSSATTGTKTGEIELTTPWTDFHPIFTQSIYAAFFGTSVGTADKSNEMCTIYYNGPKKCTITMPTIKLNSGVGFAGWAIDGDTSKLYAQGEKVEIDKNVLVYAQSSPRKIKVTFDKSIVDGTFEVPDYLECTEAKYGQGCEITLPRFNVSGKFSAFWGEDSVVKGDLAKQNIAWKRSNFYEVGNKYKFTEDKTLYPNVNSFHYDLIGKYPDKHHYLYRSIPINSKKKVQIGQTLFEFQTGIPDKAIDDFTAQLYKAYSHMRWHFVPSKVFVMMPETYENHSIAYGLTNTWNEYYSQIDLKYDTSGIESEGIEVGSISVNAGLHELAHAWDSYYRVMTKTTLLKDTKEFTAFYNSLKDRKKLYVDTDNGEIISHTETFAGMATNYYWHFKDNTGHFEGYALNAKSSLSNDEWNDLKAIIQQYGKEFEINY